MKVSLNWIKEYIDFELPPVTELVERIGAQLGAVEEVEDLGAKYHGVLVAKVVVCIDHPDSDHLHVCKIDDGGKAVDVARDENGYVQVVCGAPNVREGLTVVWLPPGSTVPESVGKDPFVLGSRELRGVLSNGMLASPRELALGDSHEGILELDGNAQPGDDFAVVFGLNDHIIDIENKMFTHRPDCFGILGVAREVAGILGHKFTSPDWYLQAQQDLLNKDGVDLPLQVVNELPELVSRFVVVPLSNVGIKPSPLWLQVQLLKCGVRPINNVVDVTNYLMLLTGQPLHAYDYDKVRAQDNGSVTANLVVRYPKQHETVRLLNGKEITPRDEAIMIATDTKLIGVGGVMGGADTEVDEHTQNIILECANFDMYSIRRTSMANGLFTEAVTRFNKGQSPLQNDEVGAEAVRLFRELAGAKVAGPVVDNNHVDEERRARRWVHPPVPVTAEFINARLGLSLTVADIQRLLENVECQVAIEGESVTVIAPFWRTDIETREDVVEEVGRLYGFDKLPVELPHRSIRPAAKDALFSLKSSIRATLSRAGANEVLTYSFVHGDLLTKVGQDPEQAFRVSNALSPDLQYYRLSLTPSLLDKVHANSKAGYEKFALFEMGKAHTVLDVRDGEVTETERLSLVYAGKTVAHPAYYEARTFALELIHSFGVKPNFAAYDATDTSVQSRQWVAPYDPKRTAVLSVTLQDGTQTILGYVGEFKASVRRSLKLPAGCAGFELDIQILKMVQRHAVYVPLPRFPKVTQDITLRVSTELPYQELFDFVWNELAKVQPEQTFPVLGPRDIYQREDDPAHKQVTFRFEIASYIKTLTDQEVTKLLDAVAESARIKLGAERI